MTTDGVRGTTWWAAACLLPSVDLVLRAARETPALVGAETVVAAGVAVLASVVRGGRRGASGAAGTGRDARAVAAGAVLTGAALATVVAQGASEVHSAALVVACTGLPGAVGLAVVGGLVGGYRAARREQPADAVAAG